MIIAVNTRLLIKNRLEGIGWFTYETLKRITNQHPEHNFIFIFDRKFSDEFLFSKNITPVIAPPPARHPFLWYLWLEYSVPKILKKYHADLFLSPDGFLSLSTNVTSLTVIHDINFAHHPEDFSYIIRKYYNHYFPLFAKKAKRIATVSEYSKNDISKTYSIPSDTIDVVYNGANTLYTPLSDEEKFKTKQQYAEKNDYFVFIGALHPRKNIAKLLLAYDEFRKSFSSNIKLLIIGEKMFKTKDIEYIYTNMNFKPDVIFIGRLAPEELHFVLGSALALTFVPYFEGFGIPVLEAMYCDTPVITSNLTSMPEVSGDAALLVDPFSVESIKDGMIKIVKDTGLRNNLILKARKQREKFSWQKTADNLWNSIERCFE